MGLLCVDYQKIVVNSKSLWILSGTSEIVKYRMQTLSLQAEIWT